MKVGGLGAAAIDQAGNDPRRDCELPEWGEGRCLSEGDRGSSIDEARNHYLPFLGAVLPESEHPNGVHAHPPRTLPTQPPDISPAFSFGSVRLYHSDCLDWLAQQPAHSIHGVVTDPPYGLVEYTQQQQHKLRSRKGGVWRIPPSYDGHQRSPLPRFTTLTEADLAQLSRFFRQLGEALIPILVTGAHVLVASNTLVSHLVSVALSESGLERRGEVVRLVMTMRGGDRPKNAHEEFPDVTVMPRSMWEPWLVFRKRPEGRIADNLRRWKTGGFRRISDAQPFGDVIRSHPTGRAERVLAPHPSLKPQAFLREIVRGVLPLGEGIVLDPFAVSGSTLAAAHAIGYEAIGVETDEAYVDIARQAIPALSEFRPSRRTDGSR